MKRAGPALLALAVGICAPLAVAQTLGERFQTLKEEVNAGAWAQALKTLDQLEADAAQPGHEDLREQLEGPAAFYRGVCEANLDRTSEAVASFQAFLRLQPAASLESARYSKKVVSAFDQARRKKAAKPFSLAEAYKNFRPPVVQHEDRELVDKNWADGPVRWIMTAEERKGWAGLTEPQARVEFVEKFWATRAALPGEQGRTFREEYERRIAFADEYLGKGGELRGSLTDRGMVFLLLGPPSSASRRMATKGDDRSTPRGEAAGAEQASALRLESSIAIEATKEPDGTVSHVWNQFNPPMPGGDDTGEVVETWHYRGEDLPSEVGYQSLDVHYVTKRGYGRNVLQRDSETLTTLGAAASHGAPRLAIK
ncbi:MAG TPA: GWxTD domain-containing protein [Thermoanaerobaculia bacterium]|nr:GWxTD domain-containing protein [Thermoanaerobaculia bacterium]